MPHTPSRAHVQTYTKQCALQNPCSPEPDPKTTTAPLYNSSNPLLSRQYLDAATMDLLRKQPRRLSSPMDKEVKIRPKKARGSVQVTEVEAEKDIDCPICRDPVGVRTESGTLETWRYLPCGHKFGRRCIMEYFGALAGEKPLCPVCREPSYHRCGHPVLPLPLAPPQRVFSHPSDHHQSEYCVYCNEALSRLLHSYGRGACWKRVLRRMVPWTKKKAPPRAFIPQDPTVGAALWKAWWEIQHPDPDKPTSIQECPGRIRRTKNKIQRGGAGLLGLHRAR